MPRTLLLADDSITIQRVVGITFANEDFEITTVDNGEDAIQKAKELKPNIILADVIMPKKNGYEVCQAIKSDPALRATPVLLLAGTFEAFDENRARAVGANGHITKPFESQALIDKVNGLLGAGAVQIPLGVAQPAPAVGSPRVIVHPQPMTPWNGTPMPAGRPTSSPMPSAFGQPPRPTVPGAGPQSPRPVAPGPQPGAGYAPGTPMTPRPLTPQSVAQAPRPVTQPMASAPRPLTMPPAAPRVTAQPTPTVIPPPFAAIPATPFPAAHTEKESAIPEGASKPLESTLFEEPSISKKAFESHPLEPSAFESESSTILEPEPLEPEPLEPEPAGLESAGETGRPTFAPLATGSESQPLDTLETLDVEGVDTWGAKDDITRPIPNLMTETDSDRKATEKRIATESPARPGMLSDDLSLLGVATSTAVRPPPIEPESAKRGIGAEPAPRERPFEAKPLRLEPLPEVLSAENIELPSVEIEEEMLVDQASGSVPELARSAPAEKIEREAVREEKRPPALGREAPQAPFELATAAAMAATKTTAAAMEAEVDKLTTPQLSKSELEAITREIIEKVVWEVVPQLAETILREEIEKLVQEKLAE